MARPLARKWPYKSAEVYDPSYGIWSSITSMNTARGRLATVTLGRKIYAIGGWESGTGFQLSAQDL